LAHQHYGEGVFELPPYVFVDLIFKAYERETMADIKSIWKLNVILSAMTRKDIKGFDDWLDGIKEQTTEETADDEDPNELLARVKRDLGKA